MKKRTFFSRSRNSWPIEQWRTSCKDLSFKLIEQIQIPSIVPKTLYTKCVHGAILATSGTVIAGEDYFVAYINLFRTDNQNIDEQQYVAFYKSSTHELQLDGYVQHGSYSIRTLAPNNFRYPTVTEGGLTILRQQNLIEGLDFAGELVYNIIANKKDST